jgi:hypothetical protein
MLDGFDVGGDFLGPELVGGAAMAGLMLGGEVFGRENSLGVRSSMRKAPPFVLGNTTVAVAMEFSYCTVSILSKIPAAPWPPPTHMVTMP